VGVGLTTSIPAVRGGDTSDTEKAVIGLGVGLTTSVSVVRGGHASNAEKAVIGVGVGLTTSVPVVRGSDVIDKEKDGYLIQKGLRAPAKSSVKVCNFLVSFSLVLLHQLPHHYAGISLL
jgi:hypothetical protein